jgi:hypothetical protein
MIRVAWIFAVPLPSPAADRATPAPPSAERRFTFDADVAGSLPVGFAFGRTGAGAKGPHLDDLKVESVSR